jgi:hypothetical protein
VEQFPRMLKIYIGHIVVREDTMKIVIDKSKHRIPLPKQRNESFEPKKGKGVSYKRSKEKASWKKEI